MKTNPGNYSTIIKSTTETAFQRAIILNGPSVIDGETIEWLDIELPVDRHRTARSCCVDLIGRSESSYVICELKFGDNSATDNPDDAATEIRRYKKDIQYNFIDLDEEDNVHHKNGEHFYWKDVASNARFIIAANKAYWDYWLYHRGAELPEDINCYSLDIDVDCFKEQKNGLESYAPALPDCHWTLVKR